jgi:hypothetical protein
MITKQYAKQLSEKITDNQIRDLIQKTKVEITEWAVSCRCNKNFSRGKFWNIFCADYKNGSIPMVKRRILEEFGDLLPNELKEKPKTKRIKNTPFCYHEEPKFKELWP